MKNQAPPPSPNNYVSFLLALSHIQLAMDYMDKATDDMHAVQTQLSDYDKNSIKDRLNILEKLKVVLYSTTDDPLKKVKPSKKVGTLPELIPIELEVINGIDTQEIDNSEYETIDLSTDE